MSAGRLEVDEDRATVVMYSSQPWVVLIKFAGTSRCTTTLAGVRPDLRDGVDALSPADRELFRIPDFIIDYEMGGLSAYFYNRLPDLDGIQATVAAMQRYGLAKLAALLDEAARLFDGYTDPDPPTTWTEVCRRYDPAGRLDELDSRIGALDNYGLG